MFLAAMPPHERLRQARRAAGYVGPTEAARRFHWKPDTYKKHEAGSRNLTPTVAERYARAFRCTPAWLLYGDGDEPALQSQLPAQLNLQLAARAVALARRFLAPLEAVAELEDPVSAAIYALLMRLDQGHPIVDDEPTTATIEALVREIAAKKR
jgi:hypothetical protein